MFRKVMLNVKQGLNGFLPLALRGKDIWSGWTCRIVQPHRRPSEKIYTRLCNPTGICMDSTTRPSRLPWALQHR
ncbi:hypothetical protein TNCV_2787071 [Trichonephila clavipes]|nr:hypothetical protein TNCV_2787071 [Trichonephila clavipes]